MDEYISREDVLDIASQYCADDDGSCSKADVDLREMLDEIETLPAADVQPVKHGRWIEQRHTPTNGYNYNVPYSTYVCSSCGLEIHNDEYSKYVRGTYTNCPVCTARMDVSE